MGCLASPKAIIGENKEFVPMSSEPLMFTNEL
jgi:hypothetical protein